MFLTIRRHSLFLFIKHTRNELNFSLLHFRFHFKTIIIILLLTVFVYTRLFFLKFCVVVLLLGKGFFFNSDSPSSVWNVCCLYISSFALSGNECEVGNDPWRRIVCFIDMFVCLFIGVCVWVYVNSYMGSDVTCSCSIPNGFLYGECSFNFYFY